MVARRWLPPAVAVGAATLVGVVPVLPYLLVASRGFVGQAIAWGALVGATAAGLALLLSGRRSVPFTLGVSTPRPRSSAGSACMSSSTGASA